MKKLTLLFVFVNSLIFAQGEQRYADSTATDQNGNTFEWINYGTQDWAIENAEVVTYRDGTEIPQVTDNGIWENLTTGAWCYYNNDSSKGKLYNWYAVAGIHNIASRSDPALRKEFAPEGWQVPSNSESGTLESYLIAKGYNYDQFLTGNKIAKSMASTTSWDSSPITGAPGKDQNLNNRSGFNAIPEGYRRREGTSDFEGSAAPWWCSSDGGIGSSNANYYGLNANSTHFDRSANLKQTGYSVRFVRDVVDTEAPVITLIGESPVSIDQDATYTDPGAQAYDNVDGNLTSSIVVSGTVDTSTPGTYYINYNVTDSAGNAANQATRTVVVVETTPTLNAGPDQAICEYETVTLGEATASNVSSVIWTTSGDGAFDNPSIINPTYIPGPQDRIMASFHLTLNAQGSNGQVYSDRATIIITSLPTVSAGTNFEINEGVTFQLSEATASNESSVIWTTTGTGSFSDSARINPVYTPSQNDIHNGYVDLIITAHPIAPCATSASDTVRITINPNPTLDAGPDLSVCQGESISIAGASASNFSNLLWEVVSGNGTLNDAAALTPTYIPAPNDIANGIVTLRLTAYGTNNQQVSDEIQIVIEPCNTDILLNGIVSAENNQIKNVADPTDAQDAVTKTFIENFIKNSVSMEFFEWNISKVNADNQTIQLSSKPFVFVNAANTTIILPDESQVSEMDVIYIYSLRGTNNAPIEDCAITFTSNYHPISSYKISEGLITASVGQKIYGRFPSSGLKTIVFIDGQWFIGNFDPYSILD